MTSPVIPTTPSREPRPTDATAPPGFDSSPPILTRVEIPASIDPTGRTNVSSELVEFLATVPDGSAIVFKPGGTYTVEPGLRLVNRRHLAFEGNGATIKSIGWERSALAFWGGDHITVADLTLLGDNVHAGTANAYHSGGEEFSASIQLYGVSNVEIANVTMTGAWGDCLYVNTNGPTNVWSDTVWLHDSTCQLNGRSALVVNGAENVTVERVLFDRIATSILDVEPEYPYEGATNVRLVHNTVGSYGLATQWACWFVSANGLAGTLVSGLTISGNTVAGNPVGYESEPCALNTNITESRRSDVVFTNNTTLLPAAGPVLLFSHVDGLTVTGNVQPLTSGSLARIRDSTGVTAQ